MAKHPFIETSKGTATILFRGKDYIVQKSNPHYAEIIELARSGSDDVVLDELLNPTKRIADITLPLAEVAGAARVMIIHGEVLYDGQPLHNAVTRKIQDFAKRGLPYEPLVNFLANLMENPSMRAVNELYDFLDRVGLPITEDGHFIAYKGVRDDLMDKHSGTFDNSPGQVLEMRRNAVDDDRARDCSYGFHVGAYQYARSFGSVVLRVKVNPRDAVAVPTDHSCQKLRTCKYVSMDIYDADKHSHKGELTLPLYGNAGEVLTDTEIRAKYPASKPNMELLSKEQIAFREDVIYAVTHALAVFEGIEYTDVDLDEEVGWDAQSMIDDLEENLELDENVTIPLTDKIDNHSEATGNDWIDYVFNFLKDFPNCGVAKEAVVVQEPVVTTPEVTTSVVQTSLSKDASNEELTKAAQKLYEKNNRDEIVDKTLKAKLVTTKEEARRMGKWDCCIALAKKKLKLL